VKSSLSWSQKQTCGEFCKTSSPAVGQRSYYISCRLSMHCRRWSATVRNVTTPATRSHRRVSPRTTVLSDFAPRQRLTIPSNGRGLASRDVPIAAEVSSGPSRVARAARASPGCRTSRRDYSTSCNRSSCSSPQQQQQQQR